MTKRGLLRILERERESFAAERKLLIEQICHLSRQPWTVSPSDMSLLQRHSGEEEVEEPQYIHVDHWPDE